MLSCPLFCNADRSIRPHSLGPLSLRTDVPPDPLGHHDVGADSRRVILVAVTVKPLDEVAVGAVLEPGELGVSSPEAPVVRAVLPGALGHVLGEPAQERAIDQQVVRLVRARGLLQHPACVSDALAAVLAVQLQSTSLT